MSLCKIADRLRTMGLNEKQVDEIIDMIRDFAAALTKRLLWI
jgi:hypothetical protein